MWIETVEHFINLDRVQSVRRVADKLRLYSAPGCVVCEVSGDDVERVMEALRAKLAITRDIMSVTRRMHGPDNGDLRIPVALASCPGDD